MGNPRAPLPVYETLHKALIRLDHDHTVQQKNFTPPSPSPCVQEFLLNLFAMVIIVFNRLAYSGYSATAPVNVKFSRESVSSSKHSLFYL